MVRRLEKAHVLPPWILAGGTGLALQLGHRISMDLDFFSEHPFDSQALRVSLSGLGQLEVQAQNADTLHARLDGIPLSFRTEVPFVFPTTAYRGLRLADARDIAAMIMGAVSEGKRKDFVDLHAYLEAGGEFPSLMELLNRRYAGTSFNAVHLLRSLVYFEDAEQEPMPRMIHKTAWKDIRARLEEEVRRWAP